MAREKNIEVFVDGAHAFAHFPFTRDELECRLLRHEPAQMAARADRDGLPVRAQRDKIRSLWPLMAAPATMDENIRKYEEIGTHPAANHNAIAARRSRFIRADRRASARSRGSATCAIGGRSGCSRRARAFGCSRRSIRQQAGAIALFNVDGLDTRKLQTWLWTKHRIMTTPIIHAEFHGLRDHA